MPEVSLLSEILVDLSAAADDLPAAKLLYSRKESCHLLSISIRYLDLAIAAGRLKVRKIGTRVLVEAKELEKFARTSIGFPHGDDGQTCSKARTWGQRDP
jgi:F420-dependent methylenetetrahydromethanopterin dehydrogenase